MNALFAVHLWAFVLINGRSIVVMDQGPQPSRVECEQQIKTLFAALADTHGVTAHGDLLLGAACKVPGTET